ncbi:histidine kinase [Sphaerisporangium siamense]|uniref:Uncharacterized protein YecE (DUF72 family) n=1 Tax=Sphaerisporangium siamense TaxID=795645 RepID=A0A7W7DA79_9ACTN|nr:DUF72 domain-containing protein [Sphaerisporangium siamense]MBB4703127.1 uncharacterized protein YecE (DUF72 family) [Sphaerisporangium siamense]GII89314.1 histidine kinase [Sphaerisporangium siamense]
MVLVGTSGWQYKHWRDVLYPAGLPQRLWLERYAECFATVENNNAFYRLPPRETFEAWRDRTPAGFVMAVKASRFLTHIKRLKDPEEPVERLMEAAGGLGRKLGPVLLQLPPTLRADPGRLDACLRRFPAGTRVAVEPRHRSWWTGEVRDVLARHGAALCWADVLGRPVTPLWRTAGWGYLRLHQGRADPWPSYGEASLRSWLHRLSAQWDPAEHDLYVYFNNDPEGAAVRNAVRFAALARGEGIPVSRTPEELPEAALT